MSDTGNAARPLVIQTEHLDVSAAAWLRERCDLVVQPADGSAAWYDALGRAAGLVVRTYTRVDEAMLARAPCLRVVGRAGVGVENIDLEACRARGVEVVNTPDANTGAVVEFVLALALDALRPRVYLGRALAPEEWNHTRRALTAPRQLSDLVVGVYGLGRIGSRVARLFGALGACVLYHDLREIPQSERAGAESVGRAELLARAELLTIHVDGRAANRGLIDAAALRLCRSDVVLINTSRGFVIDSAALAAFLLAQPAARALLDVHEPEPLGSTSALLGLSNARLTPHLASCTASAQRAMSWVVKDVWRVLSRDA